MPPSVSSRVRVDRAVAPFVEGDRWCAVGDSITHAGWYPHFIHLFHATRFPGRKLDLLNCGCYGDSATRVLRRLDGDVLIHKPTVVSLLLGANDVDRPLYEVGRTGPDVQAGRNRALDAYRANMRQLLERIARTGARIILFTPAIFDETLVHPQAAPNFPGVNGALGRCAEICGELAAEFGADVVDVHGAMGPLNARVRQVDSLQTLVGLDRLHPGEAGHFVMTCQLLKAQGHSPLVSEVALDGRTGAIGSLRNAEVRAVRIGGQAVEFECLASALPYPIPASVQRAAELMDFIERWNQEILRIESLLVGRYELRIDDERVGSYTAEQLAGGINLAVEPNTPQHRQAEAVAELSVKRTRLYADRLRCLAAMNWNVLFVKGVDRTDRQAVRRALDADVELQRGQPWYEFNKSQVDLYMQSQPHEEEYRVEIARWGQAMWEINQPCRHHYRLMRV